MEGSSSWGATPHYEQIARMLMVPLNNHYLQSMKIEVMTYWKEGMAGPRPLQSALCVPSQYATVTHPQLIITYSIHNECSEVQNPRYKDVTLNTYT